MNNSSNFSLSNSSNSNLPFLTTNNFANNQFFLVSLSSQPCSLLNSEILDDIENDLFKNYYGYYTNLNLN